MSADSSRGDYPTEILSAVLNDSQLQVALEQEKIFRAGTWDATSILGSSYVLRLGHYVDYPRSAVSRGGDGHRVLVRHELGVGQKVELTPGQTVLASVQERFAMADDCMALTVPRGLMFAETLFVASSYVDPGFSDDFFVPITNVSDRVIRLPYALPLVRVFFFQLSGVAKRPFRPGTSTSIAQELEAVPSPPPLDAIACEAMTDEDLIDAVRSGRSANVATAEVLARLVPKEKAAQFPAPEVDDYPRAVAYLGAVSGSQAAITSLVRRRQLAERTFFAISLVTSIIIPGAYVITRDQSVRQFLWVSVGAIFLGAAGSALFALAVRVWRRIIDGK